MSRKKKIHSAIMVKGGMVYLLWTRINKKTFSTHANYFNKSSGVSYDGKGTFWNENYSMNEVVSKTYKESVNVMLSKIKEKVGSGYTVVNMRTIELEDRG
jgi:hypothetical protein